MHILFRLNGALPAYLKLESGSFEAHYLVNDLGSLKVNDIIAAQLCGDDCKRQFVIFGLLMFKFNKFRYQHQIHNMFRTKQVINA